MYRAPPFGSPVRTETGSATSGVLLALTAYGIWGFAPVYWKALASFPAGELLAWRILTSCVVGLALVWLTRSWGALLADLCSPKRCATLAITAALIGTNWLTFLWAVLHEQVIATSLGYYITPLVNVLLGVTILRERLRPGQAIAVLLAAAGIGQLALSVTTLPWVTLLLAFSFACYGLIRKLAPGEPVVGFGLETLFLAPFAMAHLVVLSRSTGLHFPGDEFAGDLLIAGAGAFTAAPLICFNAAARRLRLVTLGFFQYIAPSLSLVLALALFGEPFRTSEAIAFGCVWLALALYSVDSLRARRSERIRP